jgi:hypothetical protein
MLTFRPNTEGHRLHVEVKGSVARANEKAAELSRRAWLLLWRRNGPRPSAQSWSTSEL